MILLLAVCESRVGRWRCRGNRGRGSGAVERRSAGPSRCSMTGRRRQPTPSRIAGANSATSTSGNDIHASIQPTAVRRVGSGVDLRVDCRLNPRSALGGCWAYCCAGAMADVGALDRQSAQNHGADARC
jgi:hypothetical protein